MLQGYIKAKTLSIITERLTKHFEDILDIIIINNKLKTN